MSYGKTLYAALKERCGSKPTIKTVTRCVKEILTKMGVDKELIGTYTEQYVPAVFSAFVYNDDMAKTVKTLGEGSYGKVELIADLSTRTKFARKTFLSRGGEGIDYLALREIIALKNMSNANIVPILASLVEKKKNDKVTIFAVLPAANMTLRDYLRDHIATMTLNDKKFLMYQIINGMCEMESRHYLHRDLKPQNILMTTDGHAWIADFGLCELNFQDGAIQDTNVQTLWYRAPEVTIRDPFYNGAVDVFSIGCIFAEFFRNGIPLFTPSSESEMMLMQCDKLSKINPAIHKSYEPFMKYLEKYNLKMKLLQLLNELPNVPSEGWKQWGKKFIFTSSDEDAETDDVTDMIMDMLNVDPTKRPSFSMLSVNPIFASFPPIVTKDYLSFGEAWENGLYPKITDLDALSSVNGPFIAHAVSNILRLAGEFRGMEGSTLCLAMHINMLTMARLPTPDLNTAVINAVTSLWIASKVRDVNAIEETREFKYPPTATVYQPKSHTPYEADILGKVTSKALGSPTIYDLAVELLLRRGVNVYTENQSRRLSAYCYAAMVLAMAPGSVVNQRLRNKESFTHIAHACVEAFTRTAMLSEAGSIAVPSLIIYAEDGELVAEIETIVNKNAPVTTYSGGTIVGGRLVGNVLNPSAPAASIEGIVEDVVMTAASAVTSFIAPPSIPVTSVAAASAAGGGGGGRHLRRTEAERLGGEDVIMEERFRRR